MGLDLFPVIGGKKRHVCRICHPFGVLASPRLCAGGAWRRSDVKYDTRVVFAALQNETGFFLAALIKT
jgi:hypothetical protein